MASEMVFGQFNKIRSWSRGARRKDLGVDVVAQLLYTDNIIPGCCGSRKVILAIGRRSSGGRSNVASIVSS